MRHLALIAALALAACNPAEEPAEPQPQTPAEQAPAPAATPKPSEGPAGVVPAAYQGEWNTSLEDCGSGMNDSRLEIGRDTIRFYESGGRIKSVSVWDSGELTVLADLTGEGETREATYTFRLSEDGQTLTDLNGGFTRRKCPAS